MLTLEGGWIQKIDYFTQDGVSVKFPLTIEARRVIKLNVILEIGVPLDVWKTMQTRIPLDKELSYSNTEQLFDDAGFYKWGYLTKPSSAAIPTASTVNITPYYRYILVTIGTESKTIQGKYDFLGYFMEDQGE